MLGVRMEYLEPASGGLPPPHSGHVTRASVCLLTRHADPK